MFDGNHSACINIPLFFILLIVHIWFMKFIIDRIVSRMMLFNYSTSFIIKVHKTQMFIFPLFIWLFMLFFFWLFQLTFSHILMVWAPSFVSGLFLLNPSTLNKQWSLENFGVDLNHLIFIVYFLFLLLSFKLFYPISNDCSWLINIWSILFQNLPHNWSELLFPQLSHSLLSLLSFDALLFLFELLSSELHQSLKFLGFWYVGKIFLVLSLLIFGVSNIVNVCWFFCLICSSGFCRSIFKRKRLDFCWLFYIFGILQIKMKMLMDRFKVRNPMWYFWDKRAIPNTSCRNCSLSSSFLL